MSDIYRHRGDTTVIQRTIKNDAGAVLNIAGWTIWLTINAEAEPDDATHEMAQLAGVITDALNGVVEFSPLAEDVDFVGRFFYDIKAIDPSGTRSTLYYGQFIFFQDITKLDEVFEWTPDEDPDDGDPVPLSGDGFWIVGNSVQSVTYESRYDPVSKADRRVIRTALVPVHAFDGTVFLSRGSDFHRWAFPLPGWEWRLTGYIDRGVMKFQIWEGDGGYTSIRPSIFTETGTAVVGLDGSIVDITDGDTKAPNFIWPDPIGWPAAGWYQLGVRVNADWTIEALIKPEAIADNWFSVHPSLGWPTPADRIPPARPDIRREYPENAASVAELWKFEWRRLT